MYTNRKIRNKLFKADIIVYIENPSPSIEKTYLSQFSKVAGYKINLHKSLGLQHTNNKLKTNMVNLHWNWKHYWEKSEKGKINGGIYDVNELQDSMF